MLPVVAQLAGKEVPWFVYALGAFTVVYVAILRPLLRRKKADPLERTTPQLSLAQQRNVEREMSNLLVELSEMARQVTAQLDTRARKLQLLLDEADRRIARLEQLSAGPALGPGGPASRTPPPASPTSPGPSGPEGGLAPSDARKEPELAAQMAGADGPPTPAAPDARHTRVYELADAGRSAHEIAAELDRPRGEIELILALRPR